MITEEEIEKLRANSLISEREIKALLAQSKSPHDKLKEMKARFEVIKSNHEKEVKAFITKYNLDFKKYAPKLVSNKVKRETILQKKLDQANMCMICSNDFKSTKDMHLDHCHETKKYRGLLCHNCNVGLGHFKDHVGKLQSAVDYLMYWRKIHSST